MRFSSFSDFIAMGGYGFYVWLSFGLSFALLALLIIFSQISNKQTKMRIAKQYLREQKLKAAQAQQQE